MTPEKDRPKNCGECVRFRWHKMEIDGTTYDGSCDEWPVPLTADCVCHPNIGWKRKEREVKNG